MNANIDLATKILILYREIEEHATEYAERRGELLDMKAEAESAGRPFYQPSANELEEVNEVIAQDEDQELILTALAYGYIRPVLGQEGIMS